VEGGWRRGERERVSSDAAVRVGTDWTIVGPKEGLERSEKLANLAEPVDGTRSATGRTQLSHCAIRTLHVGPPHLAQVHPAGAGIERTIS
jgi:hypothetical protein